MKYDNGKPPINLVPPEVITAAAKVFGFGAEKYGENNWRQDLDKFPYSRHYGSIMRHLLAFHSGEDLDPESGLPHTHHALTQMMILVMCEMQGKHNLIDDRFKVETEDAITLTDLGADVDDIEDMLQEGVSTLIDVDDVDLLNHGEKEVSLDLIDLDNVTTITASSKGNN